MGSLWAGNLVRLRAIEPTDEGYYRDFLSDSDDARAVFRVEPPQSASQLRQELEGLAHQSVEGDRFALAVERHAEPGMVGAVSTRRPDPRTGTFSYGIAIAGAHRRRGYATEAALMILRYMFAERRYHKCLVEIHDTNVASIRLHARLGFVREGLLREQEYLAGRRHDVLLMGLLREHFLTSRSVGPHDGA